MALREIYRCLGDVVVTLVSCRTDSRSTKVWALEVDADAKPGAPQSREPQPSELSPSAEPEDRCKGRNSVYELLFGQIFDVL